MSRSSVVTVGAGAFGEGFTGLALEPSPSVRYPFGVDHALDAPSLTIELHPLNGGASTGRFVAAIMLLFLFASLPGVREDLARDHAWAKSLWATCVLALIAVGGALASLAWMFRSAHALSTLTISGDVVSLTSVPGRAAARVARSAVSAQPADCMLGTEGGVFLHPGIVVHGILAEPLRIACFHVVGGWSGHAPQVPGATHMVRAEDWQDLARFFGLPALPLPVSRRHGQGA